MANDQRQQSQNPQGPKPQTPQERLNDQLAALALSEEYLTKNGWTKASTDDEGRTLWNDPLGSREQPKLALEIVNKTRDGGTETIKQMVAPVLPWIYSRSGAELVQRQRNEAAARQAAEPLKKVG